MANATKAVYNNLILLRFNSILKLRIQFYLIFWEYCTKFKLISLNLFDYYICSIAWSQVLRHIYEYCFDNYYLHIILISKASIFYMFQECSSSDCIIQKLILKLNFRVYCCIASLKFFLRNLSYTGGLSDNI